MKNVEEEIKRQGEKIEDIQKDIKVLKRVYITSLIFKVLIIAIPLIGLVVSIPYIMEFYEEVMGAVSV